MRCADARGVGDQGLWLERGVGIDLDGCDWRLEVNQGGFFARAAEFAEDLATGGVEGDADVPAAARERRGDLDFGDGAGVRESDGVAGGRGAEGSGEAQTERGERGDTSHGDKYTARRGEGAT